MMLSSIRKKAAVLLLVLFMFVACAGVALASSEHASHAEAKGWAKTDTFRVVNFAVLACALFFLLRKPVANGLNSRIATIRQELETLEARKEEARKELEAYKERLAALDKEAEEIIADYRRQGEAAKARIIESAKAAAAKIEEQAKRNIENEFESAKQKLRVEIFEKALARAEDLVREKITLDDQGRLVDEYLEKVVL
ncbi:MAG: hypothetical protein B5M56_00525 [Desulfococcus sp. 4484_241]|nr:MAG: hypothetical protein B5M56_00525 [Desulfococcus sp. 4484_241]